MPQNNNTFQLKEKVEKKLNEGYGYNFIHSLGKKI